MFYLNNGLIDNVKLLQEFQAQQAAVFSDKHTAYY